MPDGKGVGVLPVMGYCASGPCRAVNAGTCIVSMLLAELIARAGKWSYWMDARLRDPRLPECSCSKPV